MRIGIAVVLNLVVAVMIAVRVGVVPGAVVAVLALLIGLYGPQRLSARVTLFVLICELFIGNVVYLLLGRR